jgi:hypothetical protein
MRAVVMVVADVFSKQTFQMALVNCDDVIQQFAAATAYPSLRNSILPRPFVTVAYGLSNIESFLPNPYVRDTGRMRTGWRHLGASDQSCA